MRKIYGLSLVSGLFFLLGVTHISHAYECSPVDESDPTVPTQVWRQTCIPFVISTQSEFLDNSEMRSTVVSSFDRWSKNTQSCTSLSFVYGGLVDFGAGFDATNPSNNHNVVTSLDTQEALDQARADGSWPAENLVAITLTRFVPSTGEIVDADIVFNNASFDFEIIEEGTACGNNSMKHDLMNTLVHEVGHFVGFAHVADANATMFQNAMNCETKKRDLENDDQSGLCSVYPASGPIVTCQPSLADYDSAGTQGFRSQCSRVEQVPVDGCDCSAINKQSQAMLAHALLLFGGLSLLCCRRRRR